MSNGWDIGNAVPEGVQDSWARNLDEAGNLLPERALLHEVIIQTVTERRVQVNPTDKFDDELLDKIREIRSSEGFKNLAESGEFTQEDVAKLLDDVGLEKLPTVPKAQHTTIMVTGGPATGKTALVNGVQAERPDIVNDAVKINPDDYRAIFANPAEFGQAYADMAQKECNEISKVIMERLQGKIAAGEAPHVLLDVVSPNARRMALANESSELVVVAGTKPADVAVEHSYTRGLPTVDEATGITVPGRQTPTFVVLEGAAKASGSNPEVFKHPNVSFELFDTNTGKNPETGKYNPPKSIAEWNPETKTMTVNDPDAFMDFIERQNLNDQAKAADEMLAAADRTPANLTDNLTAYTQQGITVDFVDPETNRVAMSLTPDGVVEHSPLTSNRGNNFFGEVAQSFDEARVKTSGIETPKLGTAVEAASGLDEAIAGAKTASVAADGIKLSSKALKMTVAGGIAVTGGVAAVLHYAFSKQKELAETLKDNGQLSEEAYQEYVELNQEIEAMMQTENAAAQGWIFLASTPLVEARAREMFEEFSNKHNLSQEVHEALGMSLFDGNSIRGQIAENTYDTIPDNIADAPEALHSLVEAKNAVMEAQQAANEAFNNHYDPMTAGMAGPGGAMAAMQAASNHPEVVKAQERLDAAKSQFQYAFDDTLSSPEGAEAMAGLLNEDQLFDIVKATAEFNSGDLDPAIQQYLDAKEADAPWYDLKGAWDNASDRDAAETALKENPEIMREYLQKIFVPESGNESSPDLDNDAVPEEPKQSDEILVAGDFSGSDAAYAGDPELAKEAMEAGIAVNPELIPPEQIATVTSTVTPQAPQV